MPQFNNQVFKENLKNFQENVFGKIFEIPILGHNIITIGVPASLHEIKPIIAFGHIPRETGKGKSLK